ncbi:SGNH/GDSL hydrolase family protein [Chitinophaga filiformis]|uniref:SGNH/GDSL hydrolase family protein n=1 Tax=Chitinophaga filiformis TaxID=104663 RepID=UPI001F3CF021|nr:SGNH/GDSL hydrolase family protein [Chitinophaga filiformis]MCF6407405.1 SGNH/GDSL hydrolase family protein [Chitinophaga filiformis]
MQRRTFLQAGLLATSFSIPGKYVLASHPPQTASAAGNDEPPLVVNAGIGGNNTVEMLARIEKDCLSHHPDLTVLMAGTNDMNSRKHVPLKDYEKNMRDMVKMITNTGSKVLLMTILPAYEPYLYTRHPKEFYDPEGYVVRRKAVNEVIAKIADDTGQALLDMGHVFERAGNVGKEKDSLIENELNSGKTDGVHPTPEGYRLMGVVVYDCIIQRQLPRKRIVCFGDSITHGGGGTEGHSYPAYLKKLLVP